MAISYQILLQCEFFHCLEYSYILTSSGKMVTVGYLLFLCVVFWSYCQEMARLFMVFRI